jgi:uncharacterized protein (DUF1330 family)
MSAYFVVQATVKDPEKLAAYSQEALPLISAHQGELFLRAPVLEIMGGESDFERVIILEFPDADVARNWYNCEEYQALIPLREEGANMLFTLVEAPD